MTSDRAFELLLEIANDPPPLVGRASEIARLDAAWAAAVAGERVALLLRGDAGIGKSRLAAHVRDHAEGALLIELHGGEQRQITPFLPLTEALRRLFAGAKTAGDVAASLEAIGAAREPTASLVSLLLGLPLADDAPDLAAMSPVRLRRATHEAVVDLLDVLAAQRPLLVIADDVQWLDPSTAELFAHWLDRDASGGVLLLAASRPSAANALHAHRKVVAVEVGPLALPSVGALIASVVGAPVAGETVAHVAAVTKGVPLFVEALARSLAAVDGDAARTPTALAGCLMAQVDRISPVRAVVQMAAVLGRRFRSDLLVAVSGLPAPVIASTLDTLVAAGVVVLEGAGAHPEVAFAHVDGRDAALRSLRDAHRKMLHRRVAAVLAESFPDVAAREPERLAHHQSAAGMIGDAIRTLQEAGVAATQRSANVEALAFFAEALALLDTFPASPERDEAELSLRTLRAIPLTATQGWASPEVAAAFGRAEQLCARVGRAPHLFPMRVGLTAYYSARADVRRAQEMAEENLTLAASIGDPELVLEAEVDLCTTAFHLGLHGDCVVHQARAAALHDPALHQHHPYLYGKNPRVVAALYRALAEWHLGLGKTAVARIRGAIASLDAHPHPFSLTWAWTELAMLGQLAGDHALMIDASDRAIALAGEQGFPTWLAQASVVRGSARVHDREVDAGIAEIERGIGILLRSGHDLSMPFFRTTLAESLLHAGEIERAAVALDGALAQVERTGERWCHAEVLRQQAAVETEKNGPTPLAQTLLWQAHSSAVASGSVHYELRAALALYDLARGHRDAADSAVLLVRAAAAKIREPLDVTDVRRAADLS